MPHALSVDDLAQNRYMLEALLRGHGYKVTSVANGLEALEAARHDLPDLVISDILMPVMDGFALCRTWKHDPQLKSVPFVFYTATYTDPKDEQLARRLGADRFIIKPMEPAPFVDAIAEVLGKQRKHGLGSREPVGSTEAGYLREYSDALVRKLERKVVQLEEANRALSAEVAERQRIEHALRDSEEHFRRVVEQSPMPIAIVGEGQRVAQVNLQFRNLFGYTPEDVPDMARLWSRAVSDEAGRKDGGPPALTDLDAAVRERREIEPREFAVTCKDGTVRTVEVHVAPVGRSVLVVFNDITERRRLERLRDQFLAAAAHELKTPVTTIKGYSQLLLRWGPVGGRSERERLALGTIDAQCDRIQRRVDEMLAAARYRTGFAPASLEHFDLSAVVQSIACRLQATTETHRIVIDAPSPLSVEADPERVDEAVNTLLDRMLRALPDGEDVQLRLWSDRGEVRLSISGRGAVVPADREATCFEPLFDSAGSGLISSVDLGLYLAKLAIERHHGRVWFDRLEGGASTFGIALPMVEK
jgi:PAS domain S-box-containing protein